jgi:hypothetical protein
MAMYMTGELVQNIDEIMTLFYGRSPSDVLLFGVISR